MRHPLRTNRGPCARRGRRAPQGWGRVVAVTDASGVLLAAALVAAFLLTPSTATARYQRRSGSQLTVKEVEIVGNEAFSRKRVLKLLPSLKGSLFRAARYRQSELLSDVDKLEDAYQAAGFLSVTIEPPEMTFAPDSGRASVAIRIHEGERTTVRSVAVEGNALIASDDLLKKRFLREDAPFDRTLLASDAYRIYSLYADRGYTYAKVTYVERIDGNLADVLFHVREGEPATVGRIGISGNNLTLGHAIGRELLIKPGEPFSRKKILDSQARLYATGLFESVEFEPDSAAFATESCPVDLTVRVRERKLRWFGFGVGYGTTDFARISTDWNHKNFLGTGKQLELRAVSSRLFSAQRKNSRYDATLVEPWFLGTRTRLAVSVFHERRDVENLEVTTEADTVLKIDRYRLHETGLRTNLTRDLTRRVRAWSGFNMSWTDAKDPSTPVDAALLRPYRKRSIDGTIERIARDNLFDPTNGSTERLTTEYAGGFLGGQSEFLRVRASASIYRPTIRRTVFAARVEAGTIRAFAGPERLPDHERFRLGGATTVRGFGEETIGPGDFLLLGNLEFRVPLVWHLSTAVFLDGGNAWGAAGDIKAKHFRLHAREEEVGSGDVRYGAGAGLRLATPIGPARLDWGRKLKEIPGERAWEIHLSLGQPF